ncbi:MAG: hypothetical protein FD138_293 [Planctomycetota bacterium]|nr:MAG: hypothetical protein FD138_293 [Planctomycetota bacterium]
MGDSDHTGLPTSKKSLLTEPCDSDWRLRGLLCAATIAAYFPAFSLGFVGWDDPQYVTANPMVQQGLTKTSIAWAFTTLFAANYHPLTWLSLMLDVELFGTAPAGFHVTNVLLHMGNVLLVFELFRRIAGHRLNAAFVAVLLAVHPQHVESVAWVSERKDVLSIFFGLWAMRIYVGSSESKTGKRMLLVSSLMGLSLLSKQTLVTLPCILLVLDRWLLTRRSPVANRPIRATPNEQSGTGFWWRMVWEKWPLFLLSLVFSLGVVFAQQSWGAVQNLYSVPLPFRLGNAIVSYVTYLSHAIWPLNLCAHYPHPEDTIDLPSVVLGFVLLMGISTVTFRFRRERPALWVGWLWYVGSLVPMIGVVQVGHQAMADRYSYFPMLGIYFAVADALTKAFTRWTWLQKRGLVLAILGVLLCIPLTWRQISFWSSGQRLWSRALAVTDNNIYAHFNLAQESFHAGDLQRAAEHQLTVIDLLESTNLRLHPEVDSVLNNMAAILEAQGRLDEAIRYLTEAVRLQPTYLPRRITFAELLIRTDRFSEAIQELNSVLSIDPTLVNGRFLLGIAHLKLGQMPEARQSFEATLQLAPGHPEAKTNLDRLK